MLSTDNLRGGIARLTPPQFRILNFLLGSPGASLSAVAAHLGVRLPTASVMLVKLGTEGLVVRARDPNSRRRMHLVLSEEGRAAVLQVRDSLQHRLVAARSRLPVEDQRDLDRALPILLRLFEGA